MNYLDGKHWLVTLKIINAENNYIAISDVDPLEVSDFNHYYLPDLLEDFASDYSYLDSERPNESDYDSEEEYCEAFDEWYADYKDSISVTSELLTEDNIDNYGEEWLNNQPILDEV